MTTGTTCGTNTIGAVVKARLGQPQPAWSYPPRPVPENGDPEAMKDCVLSLDPNTLVWVKNVPRRDAPGVPMWRALQAVPDRESYGPPKAADGFTVEQLKEHEMVGLYVRLGG